MKVIAINGSPRREGNTEQALNLVLDELKSNGIETEIIQVGNQMISGCLGCNGCGRNRDEKCVIKGDSVNEWIQKIKDADGILLGSPVHFSAMSGNMKSFLDRAFYVAGMNGSMFRHKVGASVVAVRRSGGLPTFNQLNNYLNYSEMFIPTSNYWNVIHGNRKGEILQDDEGLQILKVLGQNMVYLLRSLENSSIEKPTMVKKAFTSFIR